MRGGDRPVHAGFRAAYRALETRMRALAEADGDVFLPNPEPSPPVEYVFICMEPSIGRWGVHSMDEARRKVDDGFRNFVSSMEDFLLHFAIRKYLCGPGQRYHITDLSKGAMLVKRADVARFERYDRWYPLLLEEVALVAAPEALIFAVGDVAASYLAERGFPGTFKRIMHYSSQAAAARLAATRGHEAAFAAFSDSVTLADVLAAAKDVLDASAPGLRDQTLARLSRGRLSESQKRLVFIYKLAFEGE